LEKLERGLSLGSPNLCFFSGQLLAKFQGDKGGKSSRNSLPFWMNLPLTSHPNPSAGVFILITGRDKLQLVYFSQDSIGSL
jgi:hypothetical protein